MIATGVMLDGDPPLIPTIAVAVRTPEAGRAAVRQQANAGADLIKVYSRLDRDTFMAVLDEAKKQNLKVAAHLPESIYIEDAAAAGLGSSEHFNGFEKVIAKLLDEPVNFSYAGQGSETRYLQRLDEVDPKELEAVYQRIHESGMVVCPTVVTFKTLTNIRAIQNGSFEYEEYISRNLADFWRLQWGSQQDLQEFIWQNWMQMVVGLNDAGVPLMIGTDLSLPGVTPGFSVHEEMVIWQEAGIPAADILRSAAVVPARFMDLGDRLGTISEGKTASMILVGANPLEDIRNAQKIEGVFLRGRYFNRQDLDQLLNEATGLAQGLNP
jgi:imidazolonepropionase-like amidohydrolase